MFTLDSDEIEVLRGESCDVNVACSDFAQDGIWDGTGL